MSHQVIMLMIIYNLSTYLIFIFIILALLHVIPVTQISQKQDN